jgi:hypothetical protein
MNTKNNNSDSRKQINLKKGLLLAFIVANVLINIFPRMVQVNAMAQLQHKYVKAKYNAGLGDVTSFAELLQWVTNFYNDGNSIYRMTALLNDPKLFEKMMNICSVPANTHISIVGGEITAKQFVLNNCDTRDNFNRTLISLHLCYGICNGDVIKILKLFLCTNDIRFSEIDTVDSIKRKQTAAENAYIQLIQNSFLNHISKQWLTLSIPLIPDMLNMHGQISGFALCDDTNLGLRAGYGANEVAQAILNLLITKFDDVLHKKLSIWVANNRELTISSMEGLGAGNNVFMFQISRDLFSTGTKKGKGGKVIKKLYKIERTPNAFGELRIIPAAPAAYNIPQNNDPIIIQIPIQDHGNAIVAEIKCINLSKEKNSLSFFFKFTIPYDIVQNAAISNRVGNMGSFYIRNDV